MNAELLFSTALRKSAFNYRLREWMSIFFTLSSCTVVSIVRLQRARFHQHVYFLSWVHCILSFVTLPWVISQKYTESQEYGRDFHAVTCEERKGKVVETSVDFSEK